MSSLQSSRIEVDDVRLTMVDGVSLNAEVWRPASGEPAPAILIRSPYPDEVARAALDPVRGVREGFAVVVVQTRGTGRSDGTFDPWTTEAGDGATLIGRVAEQPWCDGRVTTLGMSYLAHAQLYAATRRPPALRAMVLEVVPRHPYNLTYVGGALALASSLGWSLNQAAGIVRRGIARGELPAERMAMLAPLLDGAAEMRRGPLREIELLRERFPAWEHWLDHPLHDDWWRERDVAAWPAIPTMMVGGWWDIFLRGTLDAWGQQPRHRGSRLVIGPWGHRARSSALGEVSYGPLASGQVIDLIGRELGFLRGHLDDDPTEDLHAPPVEIFTMGANRWRTASAWPPLDAVVTDFFLAPDGILSPRPPRGDADPVHFDFDPRDPVATIGGRNLMSDSEAGREVGSWDQRTLDGRRDVVRFQTPPLDAPVEVTGELSVTLWAATSAADTDWTAKLVDVHPDGRALNVADGIVRARAREGTDREVAIQAGRPYEYVIDLVATSQLFGTGHRIRLDVSSSNFPRFDVNPGTGARQADSAPGAGVVAHQTIFLDAERPSRVALPIVR